MWNEIQIFAIIQLIALNALKWKTSPIIVLIRLKWKPLLLLCLFILMGNLPIIALIQLNGTY